MIAALVLEDIEKRFGTGDAEVIALNGVSLSVAAGEFVAITGASGSGKSSLLHVACGLEPASAGRVWIGEGATHSMSSSERAILRRTKVGVVLQSLNLVTSLTAVENVMLPLQLQGIRQKAAQAQAIDALDRVGIEITRPKRDDRYPDEYSGGQRQRIAIARAIVGERTILMADEPTGALDSVTSDQIMELLCGLVSEKGLALLLVTHDPRFASWADRIVRLRDGRIGEEVRSPINTISETTR
jgi:putative ABC transport system ATP-binding protein